MKKSAKIQQMMEFERINCRKNISFYKDQIGKNINNKKFYAEQINFMQKKLKKLENCNTNFNVLSKNLKGFL